MNVNETEWISTVWMHIWDTGTLPNYRVIRQQTVEKTGRDFNPRKINRLLVEEGGTCVTLYAIYLLNPKDSIFTIIDAIILSVRDELKEDSDKKKFYLKDIAIKLGIEEMQARIGFYLISKYSSLWNSAGSTSADGLLGYEHFVVDSDDVFDTYFDFESTELFLKKRIRSNGNRDQSNISDSYAVFESINGREYISLKRIEEIESLSNKNFDFSQLIQLCKEINICYSNECYYAIAMLVRSIMDHIPPLFEMSNFTQVVNNYSADKDARSFKQSMIHLQMAMRPISNSLIHSQIRSTEYTINEISIDAKISIDKLLSEVVRISRK